MADQNRNQQSNQTASRGQRGQDNSQGPQGNQPDDLIGTGESERDRLDRDPASMAEDSDEDDLDSELGAESDLDSESSLDDEDDDTGSQR
jgi:hypothetical protein